MLNRNIALFVITAHTGFSLTVTVNAVSPTQAILSYAAPDNNPCTVEISESSSYTPLVHDVDSTLFTGSNMDNRSGALSSGVNRVFLVGTRNIQTASDTKNYSRALQQGTQHFYRVSCGAIRSTGTFTTKTQPFGATFQDLPPMNSDGTYNFPSYSTSDRTETLIDPQTGILLKHLVMDQDLYGGAISVFGNDAGNGQWCSDVLYSGYYLCNIPGSGLSTSYLFALHPTNGSIVYLGASIWNYSDVFPLESGFTWTMMGSGENCGWSTNTPGAIYTIPGQGTSSIIKWLFNGTITTPSGTPPIAAHATPLDMLGGQSLGALVHTFDSTFDNTSWNCAGKGVQANNVLFACSNNASLATQDVLSYVGVYNLGNELPLGSGGTGAVTALVPVWQMSGTRWAGYHSYENIGQNVPIWSISTHAISANFAYGGPYYSILDTALTSATPGTRQTINLNNSSYIGTNISPNCTDVWSTPVGWTNGEPLSGCLPHYLMDIAVGDALLFMDGQEYVTVASINSSGPSCISGDLCIDIIRGVVTPVYGSSNQSHSVGTLMRLDDQSLGVGVGIAETFWDFVNSPHGTEHVGDYVPNWSGGHSVSRDGHRVGSDSWAAQAPTDKTTWGVNPTNSFAHNPTFSTVMMPGFGSNYGKHPTMASGVSTSKWDGFYYAGSNEDGAPGNITSLGSGIYKYDASGANNWSSHPINPKVVPIAASTCNDFGGGSLACNSQGLVDISAPGKVLGSGDPDYTYVIPNAAGEGVSGSLKFGPTLTVSTAPYIYFKMSTLASLQCNNFPLQDACFRNYAPFGMSVAEEKFDSTDTVGTSIRPIAKVFGNYGVIGGTIMTTSGGEWGIYVFPEGYFQNPINSKQRSFAIKLPGTPISDRVDRTNFIQNNIGLTPPTGLSITQAQVKFWYNEFGGSAANPYCSTRREGCISVTTNIPSDTNPFSYITTDTYSPISCTSGCNIVLPVLPLHTAYFTVEYLNASSTVVSTLSGLALENTVVYLGTAPTPPPVVLSTISGTVTGKLIQ